MVDVLVLIIVYMVGSIGFQNLYMVGLNKMCLPTHHIHLILEQPLHNQEWYIL